MDKSSHLIILAGPNGAGKSTCAPTLLQGKLHVAEFVNADTIASGLSAFSPSSAAFAAGRVMRQRVRELAQRRVDFAFETTLATRSYARWLRELQGSGYWIHILFLWLSSPGLAVSRVADRVRMGGHAVPEEIVRRRYEAGLRNFFELYLPVASSWQMVDNSDIAEINRIAEGAAGGTTSVFDRQAWDWITERYADGGKETD